MTQLRVFTLSIILMARGFVVKLSSIATNTKYRLLSSSSNTAIGGQTARDFIFIWRSIQELKHPSEPLLTTSRTRKASESLSFTELSPLYSSVSGGSALSNFELPKASTSAFTILRNDSYS